MRDGHHVNQRGARRVEQLFRWHLFKDGNCTNSATEKHIHFFAITKRLRSVQRMFVFKHGGQSRAETFPARWFAGTMFTQAESFLLIRRRMSIANRFFDCRFTSRLLSLSRPHQVEVTFVGYAVYTLFVLQSYGVHHFICVFVLVALLIRLSKAVVHRELLFSSSQDKAVITPITS